MKRLRSFLAALVCVSAIAATAVAVAQADPSNPGAVTWIFTDCTGPPGTFQGVKEPTGAGLWHLTNGTGNFVVVAGTNLDTGFTFAQHGFTVNGIPTITCKSTSPVSGFHYIFTGFFTPVG